jgi:hypothetical protein
MISRYLKLGILLIIIGTIAAYILLVVIPRQSYEMAKSIGKDFQDVFQLTPEIKVNNTIVLQQQATLLELATLSQTFQHRYQWQNTWMHSKKQIDITGTFIVKCGFDLQKKFSIHLDGTKATVYLPAPQVLSIEPLGDMTFRDENGYWNWVNEDDRAAAVNAFVRDARVYARDASFVNDTKKVTEQKLRDLLMHHMEEVVIVYDQPKPNIPLQ